MKTQMNNVVTPQAPIRTKNNIWSEYSQNYLEECAETSRYESSDGLKTNISLNHVLATI